MKCPNCGYVYDVNNILRTALKGLKGPFFVSDIDQILLYGKNEGIIFEEKTSINGRPLIKRFQAYFLRFLEIKLNFPVIILHKNNNRVKVYRLRRDFQALPSLVRIDEVANPIYRAASLIELREFLVHVLFPAYIKSYDVNKIIVGGDK